MAFAAPEVVAINRNLSESVVVEPLISFSMHPSMPRRNIWLNPPFVADGRRGIMARMDLRIATISEPKQIDPNEYVIERRNAARVGCRSLV